MMKEKVDLIGAINEYKRENAYKRDKPANDAYLLREANRINKTVELIENKKELIAKVHKRIRYLTSLRPKNQ